MSAERSSTFTLITGANSGIGLELARQAAADGRNLILVARNASALETAAKELKQSVTVHTIADDLSEPGSAERVYERVQALGAEVDCLINDAGFGDHGDFATADLAKQERMISVNLNTTPAEVARYGYQMMKRGKPIAVYSPLYKFLTAFLVRITRRFALRRLMHRLNADGS